MSDAEISTPYSEVHGHTVRQNKLGFDQNIMASPENTSKEKSVGILSLWNLVGPFTGLETHKVDDGLHGFCGFWECKSSGR